MKCSNAARCFCVRNFSRSNSRLVRPRSFRAAAVAVVGSRKVATREENEKLYYFEALSFAVSDISLFSIFCKGQTVMEIYYALDLCRRLPTGTVPVYDGTILACSVALVKHLKCPYNAATSEVSTNATRLTSRRFRNYKYSPFIHSCHTRAPCLGRLSPTYLLLGRSPVAHPSKAFVALRSDGIRRRRHDRGTASASPGRNRHRKGVVPEEE